MVQRVAPITAGKAHPLPRPVNDCSAPYQQHDILAVAQRSQRYDFRQNFVARSSLISRDLYAHTQRGMGVRAIDLYSGVGGWSLGLRLAGIEVVASYDRCGVANETNFKNNHHLAQTVDIRSLDPADLPAGIDVIVGSPPCTQFSFSNRGGNGNINDGLVDIRKFFSIVDHVRPAMWVMENVPRVAGILEKELKPNGALAEFSHLDMSIQIVNMEDYGLPQRRKRCFAGSIDHELLQSYKVGLRRKTLGDVLNSLSNECITDPLYGLTLEQCKLQDHDPEDFLNEEEERINRASKTSHPVYNAMPFPDPRGRSVRTITATCTRVSRESIVIDDPEYSGKFRRLTIRERACLQGFPITFQFFGKNYSQKLRMIGNAVPPAFAFLVGHAIRRTFASELPSLAASAVALTTTSQAPPKTCPDRTGRQYKPDRTFRFAIPNLNMKSGVRFEFANLIYDKKAKWLVRFIFGTSKDIREIALENSLYQRLMSALPSAIKPEIEKELAGLSRTLEAADLQRMQQVWCRQGPGLTRPFMILDTLDLYASRLIEILNEKQEAAHAIVRLAVCHQYPETEGKSVCTKKLLRNAPSVASGLLIGSCANHSMNCVLGLYSSEDKRRKSECR